MSRDNRRVAFALFLWGSGEGLFYYIQSLYIEALGANPVQIGTALSVAGMAAAISFIPAGWLADRVERKRLMMGGWVLGFIAVWGMALARDWREFTVGLVLYSLSAYCVPAISAYVAHAAGGTPLEQALTTVYAGYTLGTILSPTVGGWLADTMGMRPVYYTAGILFGLSTLTVSTVAPQPANGTAPRWIWQPLLRGVRNWWPFLLWLPLAFLAMYLPTPLTPNFLADTRGMPVGRIGALGTAYSLGATVLSLVLGRLPNRRPWGLMLAQALVMVSVVLVWQGPIWPLLALGYFLRGSYSTARSLSSAWLGKHLSPTSRGIAFGAVETLIALAQMVAPYLAGHLYAADPARPFVVALMLLPVTTLTTLAVSHAHPGQHPLEKPSMG